MRNDNNANQVAGVHGHKHRICHPVLSFCALFNPILSAMGRVAKTADAAQPPVIANGQLQLLCKIVARVMLLPFEGRVEVYPEGCFLDPR